jgi:hypothetical protein
LNCLKKTRTHYTFYDRLIGAKITPDLRANPTGKIFSPLKTVVSIKTTKPIAGW